MGYCGLGVAARFVAVLALASLLGCGRGATSPPLTAQAARQCDLAVAAQKDLFEQLSGRLLAVLSDGGPVAAIEVCSREALEITDRVSQQHRVRIGRTSLGLRNEHNTPPAWAAELVVRRQLEPRFVNLPHGELGALLPIRMKPTCLICHGPPEQLGDDLKQALAQRYPRDQATGFELDSLRGWFWVEVPRLD